MAAAARRLVLVLCAIGAVCAVPPAPAAAPPAVPPALAAEHWLNLISGLKRSAVGVPLLVVPLPVLVPAPQPQPAPQCTASADSSNANKLATLEDIVRAYAELARSPETASPRALAAGQLPLAPAQPAPPKQAQPQTQPPRRVPLFYPVEDSRLLVEQFRAQEYSNTDLPPVVIQSDLDEDGDEPLGAAEAEAPQPARAERNSLFDQLDESPQLDAHTRRRRRCRRPARLRSPFEDVLRADAQSRVARGTDAPPPPPRFERPLKLRARLTVPRAGYSEPYTVWYDPASGAARIDMHGGTTSSYRIVQLDGRVQNVLMRLDRSGAEPVRRCAVSTPQVATAADRAMPTMPDLDYFYFDGYVEGSAERLERWVYSLAGRGGELGAVRGERLTYHHLLLVTRAADNATAVPVRYSVRVDSSVLGDNCDGYVHMYSETVATAPPHPAMFRLDIEDACDVVERTERPERLQPLREFRLLRRDPRYEDALERYKSRFSRSYADDTEEAVRKNLLVQSYRFVESGNREGATFELAVNFMADRLGVERQLMLGVAEREADADGSLPFPYSGDELRAASNSLPRRFDWRKRGIVTSVRNQALCSSCWAFAVVGAVEGALALASGRLVPLSEQALVDCAQRFGGNGCKPTWPNRAYRYVASEGLPALGQYPPYRGAEQTCVAQRVPPVTRISAHVNVTSDILAIKVAIRRHGPVVIIIDGVTDSFHHYKRGAFYDNRCDRKNSYKHAVLAVGWTMIKQRTHLILKNSWTTGWGDEGYVVMRADDNLCGILRKATYPVVRDSDVLAIPPEAPRVAPTRSRAPEPTADTQ